MAGRTPLEEVYGRRLALLRPDRERLAALARAYVAALVPGARELVRDLRALGKHVAIVSGGLLPAVRAVAAELGVPADAVHAVDVRLDARGAYAGFDASSPLARAGGKLEVVGALAERHGPLALVGDGVTDLEAAPALARFVAFGGVVRREAVFERARARCDAPDLGALRPLLLSPTELARLGA
jgi:phosphoserine phosphatase